MTEAAAETPVWLTLLTVVIGGLLASGPATWLALRSRRWSLQDEEKRHRRQLGEARRSERKDALVHYLDARGFLINAVGAYIGHVEAGGQPTETMYRAERITFVNATNVLMTVTRNANHANMVREDALSVTKWTDDRAHIHRSPGALYSTAPNPDVRLRDILDED